MNLELKQLKYFVEVAKREHISEAALELDVAQSAVSRHIRNLEDELGTALFHRKGRNVVLTTEGKHLLQTALPILEQVNQTVAFFQMHQEARASMMMIGYVDGAVGQILPQVLEKIESELDIAVVPLLLDTDTLNSSLINNDIDIAITNEPIEDPHYVMQPLFEEIYMLYGPPHHPLMTVPNPPLSHILEHQLYIHEPVAPDFAAYIETHANRPVYRCNQTPLARFILKREKGFVVAPSYINLYSHTQQWSKISLSHIDFKKTISLAYPRESDHSVQQVVALLQAHLQQHTTYH
ncbi:glutamate biosynthesis transcriptional regulator GltC [Staphylococcus chromogenes]|uniref:glutamate biosynthesis transcriptional regulator GltC n=1 Tax=Staphylococcus chromogenes TaxID=46126 RepID=UPI0020CCF7BC|nr:LysR family transcriptional regulator [Staphylococcus chromogenes]